MSDYCESEDLLHFSLTAEMNSSLAFNFQFPSELRRFHVYKEVLNDMYSKIVFDFRFIPPLFFYEILN